MKFGIIILQVNKHLLMELDFGNDVMHMHICIFSKTANGQLSMPVDGAFTVYCTGAAGRSRSTTGSS